MGYPPQGAPPGGGYPPQMHQQRPAGPPRAANPAQGIAIGLLISAALMVIAIFSHSWVTAGRGDNTVGLGPIGIQFCEESHCESRGWGDAGEDVPGDITAMSYLALIATLGGAALAAVVGFMLLNRNAAKAPWKFARGVIGAASGFSAFFVVRIFSMDEVKGAGPGWSLFVGFAGFIAGGILAQKAAGHVVAMPVGPPGGNPYGGPPGGNPYGGPPGGNPYGGAPGGNPYGGAPAGGNPYAQQPPQGGNPYAQQPPQQQPPQQQPPQQAAQQMGTAPTMASGAGGPAPAAQTHPCPRCQRPLVFVAQYQRWFCESCKQYA